ncbi:hypothetical protein KQX54_006339 [Cotesia glomerata]|uniref:Uncharacterized protein n=1 Tax=Cotesia glomerata TaxID=32391 RepID=A0AAV7I5Q2_COTGL|nr:hypothetical protein KQX54_006339 [Cotesia glomerata]
MIKEDVVSTDDSKLAASPVLILNHHLSNSQVVAADPKICDVEYPNPALWERDESVVSRNKAPIPNLRD